MPQTPPPEPPERPDPADRPLAGMLRHRLRESPAPVLMAGPRTLPAASLWTSARALVADLRGVGLPPGVPLLVRTADPLLAAAAVVAGATAGFPVHLGRPPCTRGTPAEAAADLVRHAESLDAGLVLVAEPAAGGPVATALERPADQWLDDADLPAWVARAGLAGMTAAERVRPRPGAAARLPVDPADPVPALLLPGPDGLPLLLGQRAAATAVDRWLVARFGDGWDAADPGCRPAGIAPVTAPWWHGDGVLTGLLADLLSAEVMLDVPTTDDETEDATPAVPALLPVVPSFAGGPR